MTILTLQCSSNSTIHSHYLHKFNAKAARWVGSISSVAIMLVGIALLSGIYDLASFSIIFTLIVGMSVVGLAMEPWPQTDPKTNWVSFINGYIISIVSWLVFVVYGWRANLYDSRDVPGFIYSIFISTLIAFNYWAVNLFLHYHQIGLWRHYSCGEKFSGQEHSSLIGFGQNGTVSYET